MEYVIGIDGGGTKSTLVVLDKDGTEIGQAVGGPTNLSAQPAEVIHQTLSYLILGAIEKHGLQIDRCTCLCIGTAGAARPHQEQMIRRIIEDIGIKGRIIVKTDAHIALVAGTGKEEGIMLIAGTGSIAYGSTLDGRNHRAGGWGHIIGDEGSGYHIGTKALNAALRCFDGRGQDTMLLTMLLEELNLDSADQLVGWVYSGDFSKSKIASLAKVVDTAHKKGDHVATSILREAANELFLLVDAVTRRLDFTDKATSLVTGGSVLLKNHFVFKEFSQQISMHFPQVEITKLKRDAAYGAAQISINNSREGDK